eukprot:m.177571 g.177571  ORF g.177571 m.177571 type:complete len:1069 (+) comp13550_c0_seq2:181-3387(+)
MFTQFSTTTISSEPSNSASFIDNSSMDNHDERAVAFALLKLSTEAYTSQPYNVQQQHQHRQQQQQCQCQQCQQQIKGHFFPSPSTSSASSHHTTHNNPTSSSSSTLLVPSSSLGKMLGQQQQQQHIYKANTPHFHHVQHHHHHQPQEYHSGMVDPHSSTTPPCSLNETTQHHDRHYSQQYQHHRHSGNEAPSKIDIVTRPCSPDVSSPDCEDSESISYQQSLHRLPSYPQQQSQPMFFQSMLYPPCQKCIKGEGTDEFYWRICSRKCMDVFMEEKGVDAFLEVNKNCVPVGINSHELNFFPVGTGKPICVLETQFSIDLMRPKYVPGEIVMFDNQGTTTACQIQFVLWSADGEVLYVISKFIPKKKFCALLNQFARLRRKQSNIDNDAIVRLVNSIRDESNLTSSSEDEHISHSSEDDDDEESEEEESGDDGDANTDEVTDKEDYDGGGKTANAGELIRKKEVEVGTAVGVGEKETSRRMELKEAPILKNSVRFSQPPSSHKMQLATSLSHGEGKQQQQHQQPMVASTKKPKKDVSRPAVSNATNWFSFYSKTRIPLPNLSREGIAMDVVNIDGKETHEYRFKTERELRSDSTYDSSVIPISSQVQGGRKLGFQSAKELRDKCKRVIILENGKRVTRTDYNLMVDNMVLAPLDLIISGKKRHVCACGRLWANGQQLGGHRGKCQAYRPTNREFRDVFFTLKKLVEMDNHDKPRILDVEHQALWDSLLSLYNETERVAKAALNLKRRRPMLISPSSSSSKQYQIKGGRRRASRSLTYQNNVSQAGIPSHNHQTSSCHHRQPQANTDVESQSLSQSHSSPPRRPTATTSLSCKTTSVLPQSSTRPAEGYQVVSPTNPYMSAALVTRPHLGDARRCGMNTTTNNSNVVCTEGTSDTGKRSYSSTPHLSSYSLQHRALPPNKKEAEETVLEEGPKRKRSKKRVGAMQRRRMSKRKQTIVSTFRTIDNKDMEKHFVDLLRVIYQVEAVDEFFSIVHEAQPQYENIFRQKGRLVARILFRSPASVISSIRCGRFGATETAKDVFRAAYDVSYVRRSDKRRYIPATERRSRFMRY